jgi:hypothetical protein
VSGTTEFFYFRVEVEPGLLIELTSKELLPFVMVIIIRVAKESVQEDLPDFILDDVNLEIITSRRNAQYQNNSIIGCFYKNVIQIILYSEDFYEVFKYCYNLIHNKQAYPPPDIFYNDDYDRFLELTISNPKVSKK